ncbi:MAG: hypothetical protein B6D58_03095 [candidate division Zixibacteria bacterium 4484_95]|nr:MAG: hypothetical protein B6D58_03095 [candidate division Zixibacteria bacterium 4484_95]
MILTVVLLVGKHRMKTRKITMDLYKKGSELTIKQKVFEVCRSVFNSVRCKSRKSPVLIAAEAFKKDFKLGRFVLFCSERNILLPLMGVGLRLRMIKPIRIELVNNFLLSSNSNNRRGKYPGCGVVLGENEIKMISRLADLPSDISNLLFFLYEFSEQRVLFAGEDPHKELTRFCASDEFNQAVWPLLYEICHSNNNIKRRQEKIRDLEKELNRVKIEITNLNSKVKQKDFNLHSFLDISNRIFTIYDEHRLIETYLNSIASVLSPSRIAILRRSKSDSGIFTIAASSGQVTRDVQMLELLTGSEIYKLLAAKKRVMVLPVVSSGLQSGDPFMEKALAFGFTHIEKLYVGGKIYGFVLIGDKSGKGSYTEADLEVFSTMSNMTSLAIGNIQQYRLIEKMSYTDSMTELYNYRYFYKRLNEEIFRAKRFDRMLAMVIFDIDNFKTFNDTYGHQAGDEVLKNLAVLVTRSVRAIDIVSRYGGEEFCVIMPDTGFANCLIFVERLRKRIENYKFVSGYVDGGYKISISIGGAIYPSDAQTVDRLIYCADMALLKAKAEGRNRSMMFNSSMLEDEELKRNSQHQLTDKGIYEDI